MPELPSHCLGVAGSVDERLGLVSVVFPYDSPRTLTTDAEHIAWCVNFVPDPNPVGVPIVKRTIKQSADGGYRLELTFDGHRAPTTADGEEFSLDGSLKEEPIETNPNIEQIKKVFDGKPQKDGSIIFPTTILVDGQSVTNPAGGLRAYLEPGVVWTRTFVSTDFDERLLEALGTIDTPIGRAGVQPPRLRGKRNWLLMRVTAQWRGNIWKITQSWQLSGRGGWNRYVYYR